MVIDPHPILNDIRHFFGIDDASGAWYSFWSGAGSDIGELAIIGAVIGTARHVNCHVHGCWRIGRHQVDGTPYKVCRKHHPEVPDRVTAEHVQRAHAAHLRGPTDSRPRRKKDEDAHATT